MDKAVLESLKGKGREERQAFFKDHKSELVDMMLSAVNGGARQREKEKGGVKTEIRIKRLTNTEFVSRFSDFVSWGKGNLHIFANKEELLAGTGRGAFWQKTKTRLFILNINKKTNAS